MTLTFSNRAYSKPSEGLNTKCTVFSVLYEKLYYHQIRGGVKEDSVEYLTIKSLSKEWADPSYFEAVLEPFYKISLHRLSMFESKALYVGLCNHAYENNPKVVDSLVGEVDMFCSSRKHSKFIEKKRQCIYDIVEDYALRN